MTKKRKAFKELWASSTLNKIDDVLNLDINSYYKEIIIKQLIADWREK